MNQANQKAVIQEANMNLVEIRNVELGYFSTFYSNFATQAAFMIGAIVGSLSQVPGVDNPSGAPYFFVVLYWITSATTLCAAIHSLVCAVFVEVFGQGLGLRGPLGSMIVAIEGMVVEQQQILMSFNFTVFSFGLQCVGMYWVMMDQTNAIITTVITLLAMMWWYRYSLRLYNRFSWNQLKVDWKDETDPEEELQDLDPSIVNALHNKSPKPSKTTKSVNIHQESTEFDLSSGLTSEGDSAQPVDDKNVTSGGYLTMKVPTMFGRDPWKRRYFVIRGISVYYYKDKRSFQLEPGKPLNKRPIDLEGYSLLADAHEPPFMLSLVPVDDEDIRKVWKFRTDTAAEYKQWIEMFSRALKETESGQRMGDAIVALHHTGSVRDDDEVY